MKGVSFNQNYTEFFCTTPAEQVSGEAVDRFFNVLAKSQHRSLFSNTNAQRTSYDSAVWELGSGWTLWVLS